MPLFFYQLFELGWPPRIVLGGLQGMARQRERELDFCSLADVSYEMEVLAPHRDSDVLLQMGVCLGFACKWCMDVEQFLLGLLSILNWFHMFMNIWEIKPLLKYAYLVKGKLVLQAQISRRYLTYKTDALKLCLTEQQQLFLSFWKNSYLHINICESLRLIQWILLCAYPSVHFFSWRKLEAFSFKLLCFYQDLLDKEGITNWNTGTNFSYPSCQDSAVQELNYWAGT